MIRLLTLCLALLAPAPRAVEAAEGQPPNIVFIIADDLGWGDVAFHDGNAPTPHLDRLAREGLELTQHYVAPVCSPTRAGLMTGRCWSRFGITTPTNELALPADTVTLPRALKQQGYETLLAGKWHLGSLPKWGPNHFGFDHSYGSLAGGISPWNHRYKKGPYTETWHRNQELIEEDGHVTDLLTDEVVRWIGTRKSDPFFAYVPFTAVHLPLKEPQKWLDRVPVEIQGEVPRHYAASVMHLDDAVGQIVQVLEDRKLRNNTLLVFTSDNGGSTVENNDLKYPDDNCPNGKLPGNNKPLRGRKGDVYEGGTRVPTLVSWPGHIKAGKASSPVQVTDWMPTFCALAGFETSQDLKWDGMDIGEVLFEQKELAPRPLYTSGPRWRSVSLRHGPWKLIVHGGNGTSASSSQRIELYNIESDTGEASNVADRHPDIVQRLKNNLKDIAARDRDSVVH